MRRPIVRHRSRSHADKQASVIDLERYEMVFAATRDVLYDLDIVAGTVDWSRALYERFGYERNNVTNSLEWWVTHIHPDDALRVENNLYEWLGSRRSTWQSEYRFQKADGTYCYVLDRGYVKRANDGTPLRIIGSLLDITQQKELERAKDEFISLVSHQLRTPLTVIRVYGEMFGEGLFGKLTKQQHTHINRMTDASVRLIELVDDILDVSRIELGTYTIMREQTDLNNLIKECIDQITPLASKKGVRLAYVPDRHLAHANTDVSVITQILGNLLSNAVRYTRPGEGEVIVAGTIVHNEIMLSVRDNGIGIPRAEQKHIFERFYRARNAINIEEHGTGLGLYLVRVLVSAIGGRVWFRSSKREGTTFFLTLPQN